MEQGSLYSAFNTQIDICTYATATPNSVANYTAQTTIINSYVCPSDGNQARIGSNAAYTNYFASLGATQAQEAGSAYTNMEPITATLGIYNAAVDYSQPLCVGTPATTPNPNYDPVKGVTISAVTDGTSNTAAFSEALRGSETGTTLPNFDITCTALFSANIDNYAMPMCNPANRNSSYRYRGQEYYRAFGPTGFYTHTLTPNSQYYDCGTYADVSSCPQ